MPPTSSQDSTRTAVASADDDTAATADTAATRPAEEERNEILEQLSRVPDPASRLGIALAQARRLYLPFRAPEFAEERARLAEGGDPDACFIAGRLVQLLCGGRYELHWIVGSGLDAEGALRLKLSNQMVVRADAISGEPIGVEEGEAWWLHKYSM